MPPTGQTGMQRHYNNYVLDLSVRPSICCCYQTCKRYILKTNKPTLMQIGTINPWGWARA